MLCSLQHCMMGPAFLVASLYPALITCTQPLNIVMMYSGYSRICVHQLMHTCEHVRVQIAHLNNKAVFVLQTGYLVMVVFPVKYNICRMFSLLL